MEGRNIIDETNRNILRILSRYEHLTPLQVWYELGEEDMVPLRLSKEEILNRLESLRARGYVERITGKEVRGNASLSIYRAKINTDVA